jgi:hypothetical protein
MLLTVGASFAAGFGRAIALLFDGLGDIRLSSAFSAYAEKLNQN